MILSNKDLWEKALAETMRVQIEAAGIIDDSYHAGRINWADGLEARDKFRRASDLVKEMADAYNRGEDYLVWKLSHD